MYKTIACVYAIEFMTGCGILSTPTIRPLRVQGTFTNPHTFDLTPICCSWHDQGARKEHVFARGTEV